MSEDTNRLTTKFRKLYNRVRGKSQEPRGRDSPTTAAMVSGGRSTSLSPGSPIAAGLGDALVSSLHSDPMGDDSFRVNTDTWNSDPASNIGIVVTSPVVVEEESRNSRPFPPPSVNPGVPLRSAQSTRRTAKNVLKGTLVILSSALEGLPLPAAKGIIDTMRKMIAVFEAAMANTDVLEDLNTRCQHLLEIVISPLKSKKESEISLEFQEIVLRLEGRLLELCSTLEGPQSGILARMINHEDITVVLKDVNDKITQYVDFFMLETHVLGLLSQVKLQKSIDKHSLNQLIGSLPRAKAAYNSYLDASKTRSVCFTNTRQQLLGEIMTWMTSTDSAKSSIYILDGIAGIGKSTVAQTIAERCAQLGYLGASFFFLRTEDDCKSARLFFSTLAYGLAFYSQEFAQSLHTALEHTPNAAEMGIPQQMQYLLTQETWKVISRAKM